MNDTETPFASADLAILKKNVFLLAFQNRVDQILTPNARLGGDVCPRPCN